MSKGTDRSSRGDPGSAVQLCFPYSTYMVGKQQCLFNAIQEKTQLLGRPSRDELNFPGSKRCWILGNGWKQIDLFGAVLALELTSIWCVNIRLIFNKETLVWIPPAFATFTFIFSSCINAQMYFPLKHPIFPCLVRLEFSTADTCLSVSVATTSW